MKRFISFLAASIMILSMSTTAFAADNELIVDDGEKMYGSSQVEETSSPDDPDEDLQMQAPDLNTEESEESKEQIDYTEGLFYAPELKPDKSLSEPINRTVQSWASTLITIVVQTLPCLLVIVVLADVMCLLFPPVMTFMANFMPIQIFSDEVSAITGVAFTGRNKDGSGASIQKVELNGMHPLVYYVRHKFVTIVLAFLIITLIVSNVWFTLMSSIINTVVGWLAGLA